MSHMLNIFNIEVFTSYSAGLQMLHFDPNPIKIGYLVTELSADITSGKHSKTNLTTSLLKNNNGDIRLIPLDHYEEHLVLRGQLSA